MSLFFPSRRALLFYLALITLLFLLYYLHAEGEIHSLQRPSSPRSISDNNNNSIVIFNRIPKTASTSFMRVPYELCEKNGFNVLLVDVNRPQHYLTFQDSLAFARNITGWRSKLPALYHGHFAFVDFARLDVPRRPIYINVVRRPLDRLVSYYYFLRYGDDYRINKVRSKMGDTVTFDDCVRQKLPDCDPKKLWMQIPWFCGGFKKCWEPGNRWALDQAKHNLVHSYFLVGLTEDLDSFINILESTLPRFFSGAADFYRRSGDLAHIRRTKNKQDPSPETVKAVQASKVWKMENEFYEFAAEQFGLVKAEMEAASAAESKNLFQYEKIRPRE